MQGHVNIERSPLAIESRRPFKLQKIFTGKSPAQVNEFVGLAYSLCGEAQKFASTLALFDITESEKRSFKKLVCIEVLKEHYLSIAQLFNTQGILTTAQLSLALKGVGHWTATAKRSATPKEFELLLKQIRVQFNDLLKMDVFEVDFDDELKFLLNNTGPLAQIWNNNELNNIAFDVVSFYENQTVMQSILNANDWTIWVAKPSLDGVAMENSVFTRVKNRHAWIEKIEKTNAFFARVLAKAIDAQNIFKELKVDLFDNNTLSDSNLFGVLKNEKAVLSWVETARGRLMHLAKIDKQTNIVKDYAICAPTEWNFHSNGVAHKWLSQLDAGPQWNKNARLIAQLIDPCVPIEIEEKSYA
ncbi:MAG: hypothetical protein HUJ13_10975 [Hydrogenovibrio crunogenus]|uniref:Ni,Fe-hydrogenase I large subunit n=1 Tax=Hydrogenovibrio crunogenus TaxID=39765 RepID=A0A4P7NYV7_9GAMM|nr:hypothetical protein [Hydrogenovibrio crunogenus]MBD3612911.1 hypothetical protein [Hydrogenovibrio crunogenus]QBZ82769.1 Ni,Fe-hydrogenase I large subunit [Hydrogenovibrio crunogenus]